ncbi:hypothetical protein OG562_12890 [Streptomyces sp. NBC_01275]|uniref:hypothetical protein n=1 Tax=Streptomyces sp. NBC_01275 TaxID=2903807 RepID=UPI00224D747F|nr:hypothetical protein [Streptomyces sp. NBC_01275]MCX4761853.1 hypothetical protein [Streptomyces sp. NBC_01275]
MRFLFLVTLAVPGASFAAVVTGIATASSVPDRRRTHGLLHLAGTLHFDGTNGTLLAACPAFGFAGLTAASAASPPLPRTGPREAGPAVPHAAGAGVAGRRFRNRATSNGTQVVDGMEAVAPRSCGVVCPVSECRATEGCVHAFPPI